MDIEKEIKFIKTTLIELRANTYNLYDRLEKLEKQEEKKESIKCNNIYCFHYINYDYNPKNSDYINCENFDKLYIKQCKFYQKYNNDFNK